MDAGDEGTRTPVSDSHHIQENADTAAATRKPLLRRRGLLIAGAVVLGVLLLVVVPGYVATRPSFFSRYPALTQKVEPWMVSTHTEAGCEGCHVAPSTVARLAYGATMAGEFYRSLFTTAQAPDVFGRPTNDSCLTCHNDLRTVSPKGDLQIPHRAHVSILEMDCVDCHNYLVHELSPEGKHTPPMIGCMECHDGDRAKDSCSACHTQKAAPDNHSASDWLITHPREQDDPECVGCHKWAPDWCADCHSQRPRSHTADWRAAHGEQVKVHRSCEACHEAGFCVRCHGVVPQVNYDPALELVR